MDRLLSPEKVADEALNGVGFLLLAALMLQAAFKAASSLIENYLLVPVNLMGSLRGALQWFENDKSRVIHSV